MDIYRPLPGTPVAELDTPCLLVDMDAVEHNFRVVADRFRDTPAKMRPHTKNIKCPGLSRMQIALGGAWEGVCTAKPSEAEVMVEGGIDDVLIPNQIVTRDKIARLCGLARRADIKVCVDNLRNVRDLSEIAVEHGVTIGVLIEVDTSIRRAGIRTIEEGVGLAKLAEELPGVRFLGVMSHQHVDPIKDEETRVLTARRFIQACLDVKDAIEAAGIQVQVVSTGETFSYDVAAEMPGVTEVQGGTYALMATRYSHMSEFRIANKVLATVISAPRPGIAIGDVGTRAMSMPTGEKPSLEDMPGVAVEEMLAEHVVLRGDGARPPAVGDKFLLLPWYQDLMVNRWDEFVAVRDGVVEEVWDIPGRGCVH